MQKSPLGSITATFSAIWSKVVLNIGIANDIMDFRTANECEHSSGQTTGARSPRDHSCAIDRVDI
ncbi:MAG: hypothetical protein NVS4B8_10560 [Herpetosiphon sp.]